MINESAPVYPRDPIVKVNCNVSPVVISQAEIVEKGQPSLAGMFSPVRNSSLNFSQLQSSFHTTSSPGSPGRLNRSAGYSSFVFIVQEVGGGGGWCAISSSQLKCIGCSDSATKTWDDEKIFPSHEAAETCVGRLIGQSDIYLMGSARPDWPADLNWILCSERERERSDSDS